MILDLKDLTVELGRQKVLDCVSLGFPGGSLGLLGPNGAGKTTLLRALLGFIMPSRGGGKVLDLDICLQQLRIRQKVGYMPENDCHIPGMNAVTFVAYAGQLTGMRPKDSIQRAHEILFYVGLGEERYRNVDTYSTGMRQRIKLAQALVHDPEIVLLDEPANGLDPRGRMEMLDLIKDISRSKGIHVVLSSHLLPDVEWVCEQVLVIDKGRKVAAGRIDDLKRGTGAVFECRIVGDGEAFLKSLQVLGCRWVSGDDGLLRIYMADGLGSRSLLRIARDNRLQVRHLVPLKQSLEDVFLKAIGDPHANL